MIFEKSWPEVPIQLLLADGTAEGMLTVADSRFYHVRQVILLKSNTQVARQLQINRIPSGTQIEVGPVVEDLNRRENVSAFLVADSASFIANEQPRPAIGDVDRATYQEEPANARRVMLVDELGEAVSQSSSSSITEFIRNGTAQQVIEDTVDPANNRPLPVKLTGVQGDVLIEATNLNLQVQLEGEYNAVSNPKPDSVGTVFHERGLTQDRTKQTERTTAIRGSTDTDTVSQDVAIHDEDGNAFSEANPVPTSDKDSHDKLDILHTDNVSVEGKLDTIHSDLVSVEGKQDNGNASLASIDSKVATAANQASELTKLDTLHTDNLAVETKLDTLHIDLVNVETKQDTGNASVASIDSKVSTTSKQDIGNTSLANIDTTTTSLNNKFVSSTSVVSSVSSSASSVTLAVANAARKGMVLYNNSTKDCYVKYGVTASSASFTIKMSAGSIHILDSNPIYTGRIDGIWTSINGAMLITELT